MFGSHGTTLTVPTFRRLAVQNFRVNSAKVLAGPVCRKCPVKFLSRSKICPVPCELDLVSYVITYSVSLFVSSTYLFKIMHDITAIYARVSGNFEHLCLLLCIHFNRFVVLYSRLRNVNIKIHDLQIRRKLRR